jgi:hypothetical protein
MYLLGSTNHHFFLVSLLVLPLDSKRPLLSRFIFLFLYYFRNYYYQGTEKQKRIPKKPQKKKKKRIEKKKNVRNQDLQNRFPNQR